MEVIIFAYRRRTVNICNTPAFCRVNQNIIRPIISDSGIFEDFGNLNRIKYQIFGIGKAARSKGVYFAVCGYLI